LAVSHWQFAPLSNAAARLRCRASAVRAYISFQKPGLKTSRGTLLHLLTQSVDLLRPVILMNPLPLLGAQRSLLGLEKSGFQ
jgi:hypothetical protein